MAHSSFSKAFVTGASSGIGLELCNLLAEKKVDLIISGRNNEKLQELAEKLSKKVSVKIEAADLSKDEDRQRLIALIHAEVPDLVINNAGLGLYGDALTYSTQEQVEILKVDMQAVLEFSLEAARTLISKQKKGIIMNVSSVAAFFVMPGCSVYCSSKAFVNSFSESFDEEVRSYGVRVLAACPGVVATNFRSRAKGKYLPTEEGTMMSPVYAAEQIWQQIQKQKKVHVFNWKYRLGMLLLPLFPKKLIVNLLRKNIALLHQPRPFITINNKP